MVKNEEKIIATFRNGDITVWLFESQSDNSELLRRRYFIENKRILSEIKNLFQYVYLPIGRKEVNDYEESEKVIYGNHTVKGIRYAQDHARKTGSDSALERAMALTIYELSDTRIKKEILDSHFKNNLLTKTITNSSLTIDKLLKKINSYNYERVSNLIGKYKNILTTLEIENQKLSADLDKLLEDFEKSEEDASGHDIDLVINFYKIIQAETIVYEAERLQRSKNSVDINIEKFFDIVNSFYAKSAFPKTIYAKGNKIVFKMNDNSKLRDVPLDKLSSGEQQIFVLMSHIIFEVSKLKSCILIIDEPERSLHMEWQERLVDAILTSCNKTDVQLTIATHSPEIISYYQEYAKRIC